MYKASMIMEQAGIGGWSETLYSTLTDVGDVSAALDFLSTRRAKLLGAGGTIRFLRVKNLAAPYNGGIQRITKPGLANYPSDTPWQAIQFEVLSAAGNKRSYKCPGIPDQIVTNGLYAPDPTFTTNLTMFQQALTTGDWVIRIRDKAQPRLDVANVDANGNLTTLQPHGMVVGDKVQFYRTKDTIGFPVVTIHKVLGVTNTLTVILQGWKTGRLVTKGQCFKLVYLGEAMTATGDSAVSFRKVGRPFGLLRGRRPVRR